MRIAVAIRLKSATQAQGGENEIAQIARLWVFTIFLSLTRRAIFYFSLFFFHR